MGVVLLHHQVYTVIYLNEIIIPSVTWQNQVYHLGWVLEELQKGDSLQTPKMPSVADRDGYGSSGGLLKLQDCKAEAVHQIPMSRNQKTDTCLPGASYYQHFVPNCRAVHLSDLTRKREPKKVHWTDRAEDTFQALK